MVQKHQVPWCNYRTQLTFLQTRRNYGWPTPNSWEIRGRRRKRRNYGKKATNVHGILYPITNRKNPVSLKSCKHSQNVRPSHTDIRCCGMGSVHSSSPLVKNRSRLNNWPSRYCGYAQVRTQCHSTQLRIMQAHPRYYQKLSKCVIP